MILPLTGKDMSRPVFYEQMNQLRLPYCSVDITVPNMITWFSQVTALYLCGRGSSVKLIYLVSTSQFHLYIYQ